MSEDGEAGGAGAASDRRGLGLHWHGVLLRALGVDPGELDDVVTRMFARHRRDAVSYWLQLMLAMGIATLGLALGSTAVVIGAMLIAPLMGPLLGLGMALVVGSPALTVRSLGRTLGSIAAVVAGAAVLTYALPFHDMNPEISSRTFHTALDLMIAIFVALAAVTAAVRNGSDSVSTAAGTAIGIALIPPLCVMGLGVGIRDWEIASGASMLFVTNFTAILFVSVVSFWALGFETVGAEGWERATIEEARQGSFTLRAVHALQRIFGSRYSVMVRVALPALMVAAVAVPLARALDEVAWEVRARKTVSGIVSDALDDLDAVQRTISVKGGEVALRLYVVGSADTAAALEERLASEIGSALAVDPAVRVIAVPDQDVLRRLRASADPAGAAEESPTLSLVRDRIDAALASAWPAPQLGALIGWSVEFPDSARALLEIRYLGDPAGAAVEELMRGALAESIDLPLAVRLVPFPGEGVTEPLERGAEWLPGLTRSVAVARSGRAVHLCVRLPADELLDAEGARIAAQARESMRSLPPSRAFLRVGGEGWSARLSNAPCDPPTAAEQADSAAAGAPTPDL